MKFPPHHPILPSRRAGRGFTLAEMLVAVTIFSIIVLGTVAIQIYALRVYTLAATKLNACQQARAAMNDIRDQVRESRLVYVGQYTPASANPLLDFSAVTNGGLQQGNALMIYPTTVTNSYTLVYLQANGSGSRGAASSPNSLIYLAYTNGAMIQSNDVADYVTNQVVFDAENFEGTVLSSNQNNYLIHMTLSFSQWEYPVAFIGSNSVNGYDYYQLNTVVTRRDFD